MCGRCIPPILTFQSSTRAIARVLSVKLTWKTVEIYQKVNVLSFVGTLLKPAREGCGQEGKRVLVPWLHLTTGLYGPPPARQTSKGGGILDAEALGCTLLNQLNGTPQILQPTEPTRLASRILQTYLGTRLPFHPHPCFEPTRRSQRSRILKEGTLQDQLHPKSRPP